MMTAFGKYSLIKMEPPLSREKALQMLF